MDKLGNRFGTVKLTLVRLKLGGRREPEAFLFLARRPLVTGDIIASVGLLYLKILNKISKIMFLYRSVWFYFTKSNLPLWVLESYRDSKTIGSTEFLHWLVGGGSRR